MAVFLKMELEGPPEVRSEFEKQIKSMVEKQTNKTLTLKNQFQQHKNFVAVENESLTPQNFKGFHSLPELKLAQTTQNELNTLKLAQLSEEEIELYLQYRDKKDPIDIRLSNVQVEPSILSQKLDEIKLKLELFKKVKLHDVEDGNIVKVSKDPFFYVAQLSKKIDDKVQRKRKKTKRNAKFSEQKVSDPIETVSKQEDKLDPSIYQVSVSLEESDIVNNRISIEEIRKIERFKDYSQGSPSNILFVKNLNPKIDIRELVSLFGRFDSADERVKYRILTGRMKGQAFVTFKDSSVAERAFQLINGYKLRQRPMIIEYSRKKLIVDQ